jgi:hypothetical protein
MSKHISLFNNKNFEEESSDDSISGMDKPEQPLFYMFPESSDEEDKQESKEDSNEINEINETNKKKEKNYFFNINKKSISRKTLLTKLDLLQKYHKNAEAKLLQSKIGWHTIYEFFFEKLFFLDKKEKQNGIYINLKEVEIRIRKELGKIGKNQFEKKPQDTLFTLFDKVQYNPPVSAWYSHNFLSDISNRLIAPKEKNSYLCNIINEFTNYEPNNDDNIKELKNLQNKNANKNIRKSIRNSININNVGFMDAMTKKLANIQDDNNENKNNNLLYNNGLGDKKDIIPKGAKKVVNKFLKKYNISNISYVEDEINNIQTNEKAYEVELRNSKLFESRFLDENRFLIDFNYLKNAIQKEKKDNNFEYSKELDTLFSQIDKTIDLIEQNTNTDKN